MVFKKVDYMYGEDKKADNTAPHNTYSSPKDLCCVGCKQLRDRPVREWKAEVLVCNPG